jgi:hypothetical protein
MLKAKARRERLTAEVEPEMRATLAAWAVEEGRPQLEGGWCGDGDRLQGRRFGGNGILNNQWSRYSNRGES